MPIPSRREDENPKDFMSRCMRDDTIRKEYPDNERRSAVCMSKACDGLHKMDAIEFNHMYNTYGFEEELSENNFIVPSEDDYVNVDEEELDWDVAKEKPGLWENIRRKKEREGKDYKPAKPGDPDRPSDEDLKKAQSHKAGPMQDYVFESKEAAEKMAKKIGLSGVHSHKSGDDKTLWMPGKNMEEFQSWYEKHGGEDSKAAKYQGRTVKLNKPFRTPDGPKKFSVYVKNDKGNVVKVNFGDPNMEIKKDNPKRRKSFRARHKCDSPGPKWKARYWSCKMW